MIKKILAGILACTIVGGALPLSEIALLNNTMTAIAESEYTEGTYGSLTYTNYGDYIEITGTNSIFLRTIEIPPEIDGIPVTVIGKYAFGYCTDLTSIVIPDSVTTIDNCAFYCSGLISVIIPSSVTSIANNAFSDCHSLTDISVSVYNEHYSDNNGVLFNKDMTELIQYPQGKTGIHYYIPDGVITIGDYSMTECPNLESIIVPDSVTTIGERAFGYSQMTSGATENTNASNLKYVYIGSGVSSIAADTFNFCLKLEEIEVSEDNLYYTSQDGVLFNKTMTQLIQYPIGNTRDSYTVPDNVSAILRESFYGCNYLSSVTYTGNTVDEIIAHVDDYAFKSCRKLSNVTIGSRVKAIWDGAFKDCSNLASITIENSECQITNNAYTISNTATIYGYEGSTAQAYAEAYGRTFVALDAEPPQDAEPFAQAFLWGNIGSLQQSNVETAALNGTVANVNGDAQYEVSWNLEPGYSGSINDTLSLAIKGTDGKDFTSNEYPDMNVVIDEIIIDGNTYDFTDDPGAYNLAWYVGTDTSIGFVQVFLQDIWGVSEGNLGVYSSVESNVTVRFTINGLGVDGTSNVPPAEFLYGDADLNGEVELNDSVKIMCWIADEENNPMTEEELDAADVYQRGDGVNNMDALAIQKKLAQLIPELPESYLE